MSIIVRNHWLRCAVPVGVLLAWWVAAVAVKPAEAAFAGVNVVVPGYFYPSAPACVYYYPYGCYWGPYYAPATVVGGGWGWGWGGSGWARPCWGCGRFFHDRRFFFRDGRFVHDGRFFFRDGRFVHDGRFFRDRFFVRDGRFFHGGFGSPGFVHGAFGGPGMMRGGFDGRR